MWVERESRLLRFTMTLELENIHCDINFQTCGKSLQLHTRTTFVRKCLWVMEKGLPTLNGS